MGAVYLTRGELEFTGKDEGITEKRRRPEGAGVGGVAILESKNGKAEKRGRLECCRPREVGCSAMFGRWSLAMCTAVDEWRLLGRPSRVEAFSPGLEEHASINSLPFALRWAYTCGEGLLVVSGWLHSLVMLLRAASDESIRQMTCILG